MWILISRFLQTVHYNFEYLNNLQFVLYFCSFYSTICFFYNCVLHNKLKIDYPKELTPLSDNVRSAVHEYGGGAYNVFENEDVESTFNNTTILYTNFPTFELFLASDDGNPPTRTRLYPNDNEQSSSCRFADFEYDKRNKRVYCICEDHTVSTPDGVVNTLCSMSISPDEDDNDSSMQTTITIAEGNDFYSNPVLSPDGTMLAYVTWNHPSMPWDCTEIHVQKLRSDGSCDGEAILVHGNIDASLEDGISAVQPLWSPDGVLHYLSDVTGWYNLYTWTWDGENESGTSNAVYPKDAEFSSTSQG